MSVKKKSDPVKTFSLKKLASDGETVENSSSPPITEQENCEILEESLCSERIKSIHRYVSCQSRKNLYQSAWIDIVNTVQANQGIAYTDTITTAGYLSNNVRAFGGMSTLTSTGEIYFAPWCYNSLMSFNPSTSTFTSHGTISSFVTNSMRDALLANNGCIYYLPAQYSGVVKYNLSTGSTTVIGRGEITQYSGIVYKDYIYATSFNYNKILKIDTLDDSYSFIDTGLSNYGWSGLTWAPDGCLYGSPNGNNTGSCVLKINPQNDSISTFGTFAKEYTYTKGTLASNGCIYCVPQKNTSSVLKINPYEESISYVGSFGTSNYKWNIGTLAPNGCIYCTNNTSSAAILKIDPLNNDRCTTFGSFSTMVYAPFRLGLDGKLYAPPDFETSMLVLDTGSANMQNFNQSTILSPLMN